MTSIKPPLPPVVSGPDSLGGASAAESVEKAAGTAGSGAAAPAGSVGGSAPAGQADPIAELAAAIARGELSAAQAMDRLVDRALAGVSTHLDSAQRAELAGVLRAALDGDPSVRDALGTDIAG
jgi:hypothetical protein